MARKIFEVIQAVDDHLKKHGQRFTEPRKTVLKVLLRNKKPLKAYDIVEKLDDVKPMTVYRALDFLVSTGLVHRIESLNAYIACAESHCIHKDSKYLICDDCGTVEEMHNHDVDAFIAHEMVPKGFQVKHKTIEVHGSCKSCQA